MFGKARRPNVFGWVDHGSKHHTVCKKAEDEKRINSKQFKIHNGLPQDEQGVGFAMATVSQPKHHQKSVDRPQKSKMAQESHRNRGLAWKNCLKEQELLSWLQEAFTNCDASQKGQNGCIFFKLKDGNKKVILLKV